MVCCVSPERRHHVYLLSAPLTIPLVCCYINHFRGAASCGEAMARRRKEERWAGLASRGMVGRLGRSSSRVRHRGGPERERVSDRCHASGVAVDVCSDALAWTQRAARAADRGVGDVSRARSESPRAPRITAQRGARCDPYNIRNCVPPKGTGSVSCNSVFVPHLCRFLNQEELMECKAMVQNPSS